MAFKYILTQTCNYCRCFLMQTMTMTETKNDNEVYDDDDNED